MYYLFLIILSNSDIVFKLNEIIFCMSPSHYEQTKLKHNNTTKTYPNPFTHQQYIYMENTLHISATELIR
jgi:hypothetical protein